MFSARAKGSQRPLPLPDLFDRYVATPPSAQNAVDAVPGWRTALPPETGAEAGTLGLMSDSRIAWALERLGGVAGARVLELGPLDGGHTAMLHAAGAARVDAIEGNRLAFLRCLIAKELLGLDRAHFHHGDFAAGLGSADGRYDLVLASGVLYHMADPAALLARLAAVTDRLYLWTHLFDAAAMPEGDPRRGAFTGRVLEAAHGGVPLRLHERGYLGSERKAAFCGGPRDRHVWMERGGLMALLGALGFDRLEIAHDDPAAEGGPALSVLATRSRGPAAGAAETAG
ncbi:hypothetical protein LNKW23_00260 [Paralimibaculum aggregatum]|uniref:SAM-dependent methyltransferase n=1 Tax=Paralimibaculum aggregatum TaxID=3036245 RepID=A0ABQ6LFK7_9RHOB|nr:class I SAM-dependent methyltransferase [Limibaculum sp. NKW23]GMG80814.1 hypothetical protein LNKW23_00260 [Limibaculum sp. NKW23]